MKFIKGGKTQKDNRKKIQFGSIIVPVNYRGSGNIFSGTMEDPRVYAEFSIRTRTWPYSDTEIHGASDGTKIALSTLPKCLLSSEKL